MAHAHHNGSAQFTPGPGPDALTAVNNTNLAYSIGYTVLTTQQHIAPRLPLPLGGATLQTTRAGPLLQTVDSCSSLQVSAGGLPVVLEHLGSAATSCC